MDKGRAISLQHGLSLVEVLVTIVILMLGVMGLIGLQSKMQLSEIESYQRSQALILLGDMANRISNNRGNAAQYVTGSAAPLGTGQDACVASPGFSLQQRDWCEWHNALLGSAEQAASGSNIGTLVAGRGCVEDLGNNEYLLTVAWQGMSPVSPPPASVACGRNLYDGPAGSPCSEDRCRRAVTTVLRIGTLL